MFRQQHHHVVLQHAWRVASWTLCQETLRLWKWLEHHEIFQVVQHLVGSLNTRADKLGCRCLADHKRQLHPEVVQGFF